jgi:glycosyltransferase involved in cell wall biosynthesis
MLEAIFSVIFQEFPHVRLHLVGAAPSFKPVKDMITNSGNKVVLHKWTSYVELGKLLHTCDIALCPVLDFPFTRCKSELKAIESSMAGLVPVMSDMPQYRRFSDSVLTEQEKCLVVPNNVDAWIDIVRRLLKRELVIDTESLIGRTISKYSIAKNMMEWGNFYHSLV